MKTVYNKVLPFKGFYAITILWFILIRKEYERCHGSAMYERMLSHEEIHEAQILDWTPSRWNYYVRMLIGAPFFYLTYVLFWLVLLIRHGGAAYYFIPYEREAYAHQSERGYLAKRRRFAQWRKTK